MTPATNRQENGNETAVLKCPKCGRTVATMPAAEAWCLPCGERMRPVKGKASTCLATPSIVRNEASEHIPRPECAHRDAPCTPSSTI